MEVYTVNVLIINRFVFQFHRLEWNENCSKSFRTNVQLIIEDRVWRVEFITD